jgi:hypothetical protein
MAATIRSAADWAEALDEEMRYLRVTDHRACSYEIITWAHANGSAAGVEIAREADDNRSRRLTSADGRWIVRYDELNDWWVPEVNRVPGQLEERDLLAALGEGDEVGFHPPGAGVEAPTKNPSLPAAGNAAS